MNVLYSFNKYWLCAKGGGDTFKFCPQSAYRLLDEAKTVLLLLSNVLSN